MSGVSDSSAPLRSALARVPIMAVLNALVLLVGLTAWAVSVHNQADTASRDLVRLDASMTDKIAELRAVTAAGLSEVHTQLSVLPDQRARIEVLERHASDADARLTAIAAIVAGHTEAEAQSRADINALLRTINQPLERRVR